MPPFSMPGALFLYRAAPGWRRSGNAGPFESGVEAAGKELNASSSQRSAQTGSPEIFSEHLEAVHELDDAAGLEALPRIGVAGPAVFVAGQNRRRETGRRCP